MASMREVRVARCGNNQGPHIHYQVRWRENGTQTSATFDDAAVAGIYKQILEADGSPAADAWLAQRTPDAEPEPDAEVWTVDRVVEHHVEHLTGITAGTRGKYLADHRRTFAAVEIEPGIRFGEMRAELVLKEHVARAINIMAEQPRPKTGKPLSPKSIANAHGLLSAAMQAAADHPRIPVTSNPCQKVRLPTGEDSEDDPEEMVCLSPSEFAILYREIPEYWRPLVAALYGTGMRWGEATALQCKHVDLDNALIHVRRAWKFGEGAHTAGAPKKGSRRTISIPAELVDMLKPLVVGRQPDDLLFVSRHSDGGALWRGTWQAKVWRPARWRAARCPEHRAQPNPGCQSDCTPMRYCARHKTSPTPCGCPGTLTRLPRVHDLRHSHASWLIARGVSLAVISKRLGHRSISITVDVYGHLMDESQAAAADATSAALAGLVESVA